VSREEIQAVLEFAARSAAPPLPSSVSGFADARTL
jgi:hypothetical protein